MNLCSIDIHNRIECVKNMELLEKIFNSCVQSSTEELKKIFGSVSENKWKFFYTEEKLINSKIEDKLSREELTEIFRDWEELLCFENLENLKIHIRIINCYRDVQYMHFVGLFIYKLRLLNDIFKAFDDQFSVFFEPNFDNSDDYTSEWKVLYDNNTYAQCSAYYRCLAKEANNFMFGVNYKHGEQTINAVSALEFRNISKVKDQFPMIIFNGNIDKNTLESSFKYVSANKIGNENERIGVLSDKTENKFIVNNYEILFNCEVTKEGKTIHIMDKYLNDACQLRKNGRFGFANCNWPDVSTADYIFETAIYVLRDKLYECESSSISEYADLLIDCFHNSNIFSFAIFALIFSTKEKIHTKDDIKITSIISNEIGENIKQIIQNSLQHSTSKTSIVSFYLEEEKLNICVSDFSDKGIIECFKDMLYSEVAMGEEFNNISKKLNNRFISNIFNNQDKIPKDNSITLNCLFNDFADADENQIKDWKNYRSVDSSAHVGMTLFSNAVKRCSGNFCVLSTGKYVINKGNTENVYFSQNEGDINPFSNDDEMLRCSFPGTSYYIKLPANQVRIKSNHSISQITNRHFVENYATYNKFLDYEETKIGQVPREFKEKINAFISKLNKEGVISSETKYKYLSVWTNYWFKLLESIKTETKKNVYYSLDFSKTLKKSYLSAEFQNEVFAKGLINAIGICFNVNEKSNDKVFLVIHNCNKKFVNIFIQITTQIPMKEFPNRLQLFLVDLDNTVQVHLFGNSYYSAIRNSYVVSLENGSEGYDASDFRIAGDIISNFNVDYSDNIKRDLFPFECLISIGKDRNIFFNTIKKLAEKELIKGKGYKLLNNHIRIGNKVHMGSFYEMSFLFYRTIVANNVAFYILKNMIEERVVDFENDYVLFYGYSAYSQAILTSLINIANLHFNNDRIFYATYIYNSQSDENSEEINIHINDRPSFDKIGNTSKIKIIQIVPISSTLSTFSKMWSKLISQSDKKLELVKNYTVFWVRDSGEKSTLEQKYYELPSEDYVETKFKNLPEKKIDFILNGYSVWSKPEICEECFPINVIDEIPLIETDQTSTVPSQQLYLNQDSYQEIEVNKYELERLTTLLGFVSYGHFYRGKNHFQYYIDTQSYFDHVSRDVQKWLNELRDRDKNRLIVDYPCIEIIFSPVHNSNVGFSQYVNSYYFNGCAEIISVDEDKVFRSNFICEHNEIKLLIERLTNDYYKKGDKTFKPVRFTFVDDNLITGETFRKASSLLQSLIPEKILKNYKTNLFDRCFVLINRLSDSSIKSYIANELDYNAFCNIDISNMRTYGDSCVGCKLQKQANRYYKRSSTKYAADYWYKKTIVYENEFCNSNYDKNKKCESYIRLLLSHSFKNYINIQQNENVNYFRLLYTFFEVFLLEKHDEKSMKKLNISEPYVKILLDFIYLIMPSIAEDDKYKFYDIQNELAKHYIEFADRINIICNLIKIISRPFFIYNQRLKKAILKFMIIMAECITKDSLSLSEADDIKAYNISNRIINLFEKDNDKLRFLKDYIYEALSDLNSTYLLRKSTIISTLRYVSGNGSDISLKEDFFRMYSIFIQKIVDSGSDETRALRLEYLLVNGKDEYSDSVVDTLWRTTESRKTFSETVFSEIPKESICENVIQIFKNFCNEIFLLNGVILYDGIKQMKELNGITEDYFMERWINFRKIDNNYHGDENKKYSEEIELNSFLSNPNNDVIYGEGINIIHKRYNDLINLIVNSINQKYKIDKDKIHIALLTYHKSFDNNDIRDFEFVISNFDRIDIKNDLISAHNKSKAISNYKYIVKNEIIKALNNHNNFRSYGYYIGHYKENELKENCCISYLYEAIKSNSYFIIDFDNNIEDENEKIKKKIKKIVPVYLYVNFNDNSDRMLPYMIMRDILSYRNSLIYYFQKDFTSDVMQRYNRFLDTSVILENERVVSHTSHKKDYDEVTSLINPTQQFYGAHYDSIKNWVLARNYCNSVIARLYNRVFNNIIKTFDEVVSDNKNKTKDYTYKLYLDVNYEDGRNVAFKKLSQINPFNNNDPFFKLFREIIVLQKKENDSISTEEWFNDEFDIFVETHNEKKYGYNLEFIKNIIYRICLDALRYNVFSYSNNNFIDLINKYYCHQDNIRKKEKLESNLLYKNLDSYNLNEKTCIVEFSVEKCPQSTNFDWLVIRNNIDIYSVEQSKMELEYFKMKMKDPLDFSDGHMSLLAAKEYFLKLHKNDEQIIVDNIYSYQDNYFVTRLPIIKKGDNFNGN